MSDGKPATASPSLLPTLRPQPRSQPESRSELAAQSSTSDKEDLASTEVVTRARNDLEIARALSRQTEQAREEAKQVLIQLRSEHNDIKSESAALFDPMNPSSFD